MTGIPIIPHQGMGTVRPSGGSGVNSLTASPMVDTLAWYGCTHIIEKPNTSQDEKEGDLTLEFLWVTPGLETSEGRKVPIGLWRQHGSSLIMDKCHGTPDRLKCIPPPSRILGENFIFTHGELCL